jgi:glycosyltransferase involved in cell wall biosynthesis
VRILAITHLYPTPGSPAFAPFNRQQFAELAKLHDVRIIRPYPWPVALRDTLRATRRPPVHTTEDGIAVYSPTYFYPPRVYRHLYGAFFERSIATVAASLIERQQPEIILGSWAHPDGWAAVRLGQRSGIPVVVKVHGSDVLVLAKGKRRARVAAALSAADSVVAVSEDLAAHVRGLGVPAERVRVIPHGINLSRFYPGDREHARERLGLSDRRRMILFVGDVLVSKGAADLVKACAMLRDRGVDFQCRLVGEGREAAIIQQVVRDCKLEGHVTMMGVCAHPKLTDWYHACDLVALPSHSEGIPNVLREALACGKPFVASRVGGIPEIADPAFCHLVPPRGIAELADALAAMLDQPLEVDAGRVRRINITWEESARQLAEAMKAVVEARQISSRSRAAQAAPSSATTNAASHA